MKARTSGAKPSKRKFIVSAQHGNPVTRATDKRDTWTRLASTRGSGAPPKRSKVDDPTPEVASDADADVQKLSEFINGIAKEFTGALRQALTSLAVDLRLQGCTFTALEAMDDDNRQALLVHFCRQPAVAIILNSAFKSRNTYRLRKASVKIAYDTSGDDGPSPHRLPDKLENLGDKFIVTNYETHSRDTLYNPLNKLVLTSGAVELLKYFWDHMDRDRKSANDIQELCIGGASGIGKSCAVRLLVGDIIRRKPSWDVYYIRDYNNVVHKNELARRLGRVTEKTYLVVDQIKTSEDAQSLGSFASNPSISVILVSSANVPYFRERRAGMQHSKKVIDFRFSSSFGDCMYLRSVLLRKRFVGGGTRPEPQMTALTRNNLRKATLQVQNMFDKYRFVNGNFLLMAELFFKCSTRLEDKLNSIRGLISAFFDEHPTLYIAVIEMFQHLGHEGYDVARVRMDEAGMRRHLDYRHICPAGIIRAPIYLRAFHSVVRNEQPPTMVWGNALNNDLLSNPAIEEFVLARECLQCDRLTHVARKCLASFEFGSGKRAASLRRRRLREMFRKTPLRISFDDADDLSKQISKNKLGVHGGKSWAVHAIPDVWSYEVVDGILIYFLSDTSRSNAQHHLFVIGNKITTKPLRKHEGSLAWLDGEANHLVKKLLVKEDPSVSVHVALLFTCEMGGRKKVETSLDLCPGSKVLKYPLKAAVGDTCRQRYFNSWATSNKTATMCEVTVNTNVSEDLEIEFHVQHFV